MKEPVLTGSFALLVAGHFLQALGYSSLILLPVWLDVLGASRSEVGVVMAAAALGGLVVRPAVAWSLDRAGRKPTLFVGTVLLGGGMLAIGLVQAVAWPIVAIHAAIGMGQAALFTGYFTFAADLVPESRRTEGLALFGISGLVPLVVNPLAGSLGVDGPELRWFFPAVGLLVCSSALFVWPLREPAPRTAERPELSAILDALRHRALWPVWVATVVFSGLVAIYMSFATVVAADRAVGNPAVIWLTYALGAVSVRALGASIPDRVGPSRMVPPALLSYGAAVVLAAFATDTAGFALSGLLAGLGHGYCFPVLSGQTVTRTPHELRGTAMSVFTAVWDVAKLLLVPVAGLLADATSDAVMLGTCVLAAAVGLSLWAALERGATRGGTASAPGSRGPRA